MNVCFVVEGDYTNKLLKVPGILPVSQGTVRLPHRLSASVTREQLGSLAQDQVWAEFKFMALPSAGFSRDERTLVRYWANRCAVTDVNREWNPLTGMPNKYKLAKSFFERYVLANPILNGERENVDPLAFLDEDHWFANYLELYSTWWADLTQKSHPPAATNYACK